MDTITINYQLGKIYKKYTTISNAENAEIQNAIDIAFAYDHGEINMAEYTFLKNQNRKICDMLVKRNVDLATINSL